MNAPQSASLYFGFARSQLRVAVRLSAQLLQLDSSRCRASTFGVNVGPGPSHVIYVFIYIQHTVSSHWSTCRLKGIKHLAPHQSFIVRHSSDHTWVKGGLKTSWAGDAGVSTAASRSYHALSKHKPCVCWCCSPDSYNSEGFLKDYDCLTCTITCSCSDSCRYNLFSNVMWAASQGL